MTTYNGHNGDITLEGETLTITRSGMVARATFGKDVEPVVIPLQAIHGVRLKRASLLMNGWLQLLVGGVEAPELAIGTAASNGHTVMFTHKNREQFEGLCTWLDSVVAKNAADGIDPSAFPVTGQGGQVGRFDALEAKAAAAAERFSAQQAARASAQLAMNQPAEKQPAAWYPQPDGQQRYWDGEQWTEHFAPGGAPVPNPTLARKNWFLRHKILTAIGALLLIGIVSSIANGGGTNPDSSNAPATNPVATSQAPDLSAADKAAADKAAADKAAAEKAAADKAAADKAAADKAAAATAAAGAYDEAYGTFTTVVKSGRGDAIIALPKGAKAGLVIATHKGSSNFQVSGLDAGNQSTIDGLVNEIGNYTGTTAYGLMDMGNAPVKLKIVADGSWTIKIAPISSARVLPASISGKGDAVFKFEGDAADFAITHKGSSNFTVQQYGGDLNMGVNEIGNYSGTVPFVAGPTVLVIGADGTWTFKKQ